MVWQDVIKDAFIGCYIVRMHTHTYLKLSCQQLLPCWSRRPPRKLPPADYTAHKRWLRNTPCAAWEQTPRVAQKTYLQMCIVNIAWNSTRKNIVCHYHKLLLINLLISEYQACQKSIVMETTLISFYGCSCWPMLDRILACCLGIVKMTFAELINSKVCYLWCNNLRDNFCLSAFRCMHLP